MTDTSFNTWFPAATLITGYIMKSLTDRLEHSRALQRERENRRESRRIQIAERRADFQRKTLLDLQEAIQDLARASGAMIHADIMKSRETQEWRHKLPEGLSEAQLEATRKCILLIVRIRNAEIRDLAQKYRLLAIDASDSPDEATAQKRMDAAVEDLKNLHELIGAELRKLDDDEEAKVS